MEDAENSMSYDYPAWNEFNMSDPRDKAEFIKEYESAQQHDNYAVVIFYIVMFTLIAGAGSVLHYFIACRLCLASTPLFFGRSRVCSLPHCSAEPLVLVETQA